MTKAVFLDRDATVIEDLAYNSDPNAMYLLPNAAEGLRRLQAGGFELAIVSNQSGVGRGYFTEDVVLAQHRTLQQVLAAEGVRIDVFRHCPHAPEAGCDCRKPRPGMILDAAAQMQADLAQSWMVGDKLSDVDAGRAAGCRTVLITGEPSNAADGCAADLVEAAALILKQNA